MTISVSASYLIQLSHVDRKLASIFGSSTDTVSSRVFLKTSRGILKPASDVLSILLTLTASTV